MTQQTIPRDTFAASLGLLESRGFSVKTVLDVGAAEGHFLLLLRQLGLFDSTTHCFVDAMEENEPLYAKAKEAFGYPYAITALSCVEGQAKLKLDPHAYNTHLTTVQDVPSYTDYRTVPLRTLDGVVADLQLEAPYLLKLDVQGAEMDVLRGGIDTLAKASIVLTEIQIFFKRDTLTDLLPFMKGEGFRLFDITDLSYYPSNSLLYQCYAVFIRKEAEFRNDEPWCAPEQERIVLDQLRIRRERGIEAFERYCRKDGAGTDKPR